MPAIGDQHRPQAAAPANPFDEAALNDKKQHINEYTAVEIATLQSRLDKQLGPEYISSRMGPGGGRVHYLAADKVIGLANEVFGFNGWSSAIQQIQIDFVDEHPTTGKVSLGLSVVVRVTLKDGTYHEDVGYGSVENARGKSAAFEKAKKEGTTDALKRTLRNFGNVLGNCIYDKEYVSRITKVKVGTGKWDPNNLHRHRDFEPKKENVAQVIERKPTGPPPVNGHDSSTAEIDMGSFDMGDFDDAEFDMDDFGHPDEIALPPDSGGDGSRKETTTTITPKPSSNPRPHLATPCRPAQAVPPPANMRPPPPNDVRHVNGNAPTPRNTAAVDGPGPGPTPDRTTGFYSARAAGKIDQDNNAIQPSEAPKFDPHAQSPSIRKTSGVDHSRSVRLTRSLTVDTDIPQRDENGATVMTTTEVSSLQQQQQQQQRPNANNTPVLHHAGPRPVGNPNVVANPVQGVPVPVPLPGPGTGGGGVMMRGAPPTSRSYRPLTRRAPESPLPPPPATRQPLQDVSNLQSASGAGTAAADGPDAKRQRLTATAAPAHAHARAHAHAQPPTVALAANNPAGGASHQQSH